MLFRSTAIAVSVAFGAHVSAQRQGEGGSGATTPAAVACSVAAAQAKAPSGTTITEAKVIDATGGQPRYCQVDGRVAVPGNEVNFRVGLPENWNGKYEAIGGGGWGGEIRVTGMAAALAEGYATSATDTGHKGGDATFAPGHPEKLIDYSYRAVHEMTLAAKAVINVRYGRAPKFSYWNGCSYGGRQALEEAQRYPGDFDGILAGAPANYHTHLHSFDMKVALVNQKDEAHLVPQSKLSVLHAAVLAACDSLDGVKDGLIANPLKCKFDPAVLTCKGADAPDCLTAAQVETVVTMYAPAKMKDGTLVYPGMPMGSENGWSRLTTKGDPLGVWLGDYRYVLNEDASWDWRKFVLDRDVPAVDAKAPYLNAINPDLAPFRDHGGKLLM